MEDFEALMVLNQLPKIGPVRIKNLINYFGCASEVLYASPDHIREVKGCSGTISEVVNNWQQLSDLKRELKECERHGIEIYTPDSSNWPIGLRDNKDAPVLLYVWGRLDTREDALAVSVIGSRKTTNYGRSVTSQITRQLAYRGHTIISGLALGIDTIAHQTALESGQRTIAVLGSGLGELYPRQNKELAEKISQQGAVISEYPFFTKPDKQTFPQRNRIVAAYGNATLVTEMPDRSGAMITAQFAREMGRPIFAVPGPIDRVSSAGCNLLIQQGAELVTEGGQISKALSVSEEQMDLFSIEKEKGGDSQINLSVAEKCLMSNLNAHEQSLEELHDLTKINLEEMAVALFNLELNGMVKQHSGMTYTTI